MPPASSPFKHHFRPLALAVVLAQAGVAYAADGSAVEEITVIGQGVGSLRLDSANGAGTRLGLTELQTPASVDLITRDEITSKGDYSAIDSISRTAGISTSSNNGNGGMQVSSRGFNGHDTTVNTYDGVRLYITAGTVTFPADTWTLERVEVLRGAGSVLNGVGALATTINYVPRSPTLGQNSFEALAAAGSFGMKRVALDGNASLNGQWAARADVAVTDGDGYVDRGDESRKVAAASLLFQPNTDFSMRFSFDYANLKPSRYWGTPLVNGQASEAERKNNYNFTDAHVQYSDIWARVHTEWKISPNLSFRNDTFAIKANREWQDLEEYYYNASTKLLDRFSYLGIKHKQDQQGTRADLLFTGLLGGMQNKFDVGAEFNKVGLKYSDNFNTGGFDYADSVPVFGFPLVTRPAAAFTQPDFKSDSDQYGLFFDDVLQVNQQLSLVLGGRFDSFDYHRVTLAQVTGRKQSEFDSSFSKFTWRAGLVYAVSDNFSLYAQTSTAADPVTSPISISVSNKDFHLSEGRQYEAGLKQQFMRGFGEYTLAYFNITKENMVTRLPGTSVSTQIGQQSSDGVEATLRLNPLDKLSVDMNVAFINSQYDSFFAGGVSLAGNNPNNVPDTTANLWVNYAPIPQLQLGAGLRYVAERFTDDQNTARLPAYTLLDAAVTWVLNPKTTLTLRGRNLTDTSDYVLSEYVPGQWVFGEPRAYEVSMRYSF